MTNLEWLAKMPKESANAFLREFCPMSLPNKTCEGCDYNNDFPEHCFYISRGLYGLRMWLMEERDVHDGKQKQ